MYVINIVLPYLLYIVGVFLAICKDFEKQYQKKVNSTHPSKLLKIPQMRQKDENIPQVT